MPSQTQTPASANSTVTSGAKPATTLRALIATSPEARSCSQVPPCTVSISRLITPASSANGLSSGSSAVSSEP